MAGMARTSPPPGWSTEDVLNLARKEAMSQGRVLQTRFGFWDNVLGFYHAVNWSGDKWIFLFTALQFIALASVVYVRNGSAQSQGSVFIFWVSVCMCASPLNSWGDKNWRGFSTQNYFDKNGVFISSLFTAPFMIVLILQLILIARHLSNLAVAAGKLKVKAFAREKNKHSQSGASSVGKKKKAHRKSKKEKGS